MKCGSLLGLFGRKPSPSTQLRPGPSTLQAQARARSSALASCPQPPPTPALCPAICHDGVWRSPLAASCGGGDWEEPLQVLAVGHQLHHLCLQRCFHGSGTTATGTLALTLMRTDVYRGDSPGYPRSLGSWPRLPREGCCLSHLPVHRGQTRSRLPAASLEAATEGQSSHP